MSKEWVGLTDQQRQDYGNAIELAQAANIAFDRRHKAAKQLGVARSVANNRSASEAGFFTSVAREKFERADADFDLYQRAANALIPPRAVFDAVIEAADAKLLESLAAPETWAAMTPEQQQVCH